MKLITLLIILLFPITYNGNNVPRLSPSIIETNHQMVPKQQPNNSKIQDSIKLNTFTRLPSDIEGCACYFYLSKSDERKKEYIMSEIFAQIAYISINGKMLRFNLVNFKSNVFYIYSNGTYTLRVEFTNKIPSDEENFDVKGVIMILKGQKLLIKRNIIGGCSC